MRRVGITGGAGFIGSYITKKFLEENYKVRVSVRDLEKKENYAHLLNLPGAERLEIKELDVGDKAALRLFVRDCQILVHCGTPFQLMVKDPEKELLSPTIRGTQNFLGVVSQSPALEKLIFIASVASYNTSFPFAAAGYTEDHLYTEEDTPYLNENGHPYSRAKYYADQEVRKFVQANPDPGFEIISLFPVTVLGKQLGKRQDSTSVALQNLWKARLAPDPFMQMMYDKNVELALVDVEDVAQAVYKAAITPGLHGKNYLLSSESYRVLDISRLLNHQNPREKPRIVYANSLASKDLGLSFKPAGDLLRNSLE